MTENRLEQSYVMEEASSYYWKLSTLIGWSSED